MTFFALLENEKLALAPGQKIVKAEVFTTLIEAEKLIEKMKADEIIYKKKAKKKGEERGFAEGLKQFNEAIAHLEAEKIKIRTEMENALVPLAMAAIKKIIGRELELKSTTVVDIIATALKGVSHHKKVKIYVNKADLEMIEKEKGRLKDLFEHLQSLVIASRDDIEPSECLIETEGGIVRVGLEQQLVALEKALHAFLQKEPT